MKVRTSLAAMAGQRRPMAIAAGFFDGVHRGHLRVIARTLAAARQLGGEAWILTFETHPRRITRPEAAPALLTSNRHRLQILEQLGLDGCLILPFNKSLSQMSPRAFICRLTRHCPALRRVLVGPNWRFGRGGAGDVTLLRQLGRTFGYSVQVVPEARWRCQTVSSTRIREALRAGQLDDAAAMLGRPFSVLGTVVRGHGVGRKLGFPTANIETGNELLPPRGVYAARVIAGHRCHGGVVNLGTRPTFGRPADSNRLNLEVHLPRVSRQLYGHTLEVFFVRRIRSERTFPDLRALAHQIRADVRAAAQILRQTRPKKAKESLYSNTLPHYISTRTNKQKNSNTKALEGVLKGS